jgi:GntR family transcriptional regulator
MNTIKPSAQPLYQQVKKHLVHRVLTGEWLPGQVLPSETRLAAEYELSQGTVRKAIEEMASEGLVTRRAGKGTFVTSHNGDYEPFRFHRLFSDNGDKVANNRVMLLETRSATADNRIATALDLACGASGAEIQRVRELHGRPALLETIFLPDSLCPDAGRILRESNPGSVYLFLEQQYNILITRVLEQVRARHPTATEARFLEIDQEKPVLEVERTAYSLGGEAVEWRTIVGVTESIHYRNEVS